jgi:hypothetical protein
VKTKEGISMPRDGLSASEYRQRHALAQAALDRLFDLVTGDAGNRIINRSFGRITFTIHYNDGRVGDITVEQGTVLRHSDGEAFGVDPRPLEQRKSGPSIDRGAEGA